MYLIHSAYMNNFLIRMDPKTGEVKSKLR